jgi:hypothetical protein
LPGVQLYREPHDLTGERRRSGHDNDEVWYWFNA